MQIIKSYKNYKKMRNALITKAYNLTDDSIGQCNDRKYSIDITLRDYDGIWCIDYDVYCKTGKYTKYLDGGKICDVLKMPFTEKGFWYLITKKIKEYINNIEKEGWGYELP